MEYCKSVKGLDVLLFDNGNHLSFGKSGDIKWCCLSYKDKGQKFGQMLPVSLLKIQREYSAAIGKSNLAQLRALLRGRIDGDILSRDKFLEIGELVNIEFRKGK